MPGSWPETAAELERLQLEIARAAGRAEPWSPRAEVVAGGVFAAARRGSAGEGSAGDLAWVAAVAARGGDVLDWAVIRGRFAAPYRPGLLALREGALLERAVAALAATPDVLLVNATGADHPRRAGLALHLGFALGLPTVGVTDRLLAGGEGAVHVGPGRGVWVHAGWRTTVEVARAVLLPLLEERTPAPLREARRLARTARAELG